MAVKREVDCEHLLIWAYRDELSKRHTSSAEGIWDRIGESAQTGINRDPGHGAAQRYSHFGLPDADAERIEIAVSSLEDMVIDWCKSFRSIAAELSELISINDITVNSKPSRVPKSTWGSAGDRALKAWWGDRGAAPIHDRPRDILMVGGLRTSALVTMHAVKGSRPEWMEESPRPLAMPSSRGAGSEIVGECRGKNLYTLGSYCPLRWDPSPLSIIMSRAEYVAWHYGLGKLSETLELEKFIVLPPTAPSTPWLDGRELPRRVFKTGLKPMKTLPLAPTRGRKGPPMPSPKASPVRYPLEGEVV